MAKIFSLLSSVSTIILSVLWHLHQNVSLLNLLPRLELTEGFFTFYLKLNVVVWTLSLH